MKSPWKRPAHRLPVIIGLLDDIPVSVMDGEPAATVITRRGGRGGECIAALR
jgi:hypothetical protein